MCTCSCSVSRVVLLGGTLWKGLVVILVGQNHKEKHWRKLVQSRGRVGIPTEALVPDPDSWLVEDMSPLSPGSQCPRACLQRALSPSCPAPSTQASWPDGGSWALVGPSPLCLLPCVQNAGLLLPSHLSARSLGAALLPSLISSTPAGSALVQGGLWLDQRLASGWGWHCAQRAVLEWAVTAGACVALWCGLASSSRGTWATGRGRWRLV